MAGESLSVFWLNFDFENWFCTLETAASEKLFFANIIRERVRPTPRPRVWHWTRASRGGADICWLTRYLVTVRRSPRHESAVTVFKAIPIAVLRDNGQPGGVRYKDVVAPAINVALAWRYVVPSEVPTHSGFRCIIQRFRCLRRSPDDGRHLDIYHFCLNWCFFCH